MSTDMEEKTELKKYPCSGCAFSYTLVRANRKDAEPTVIRKHKSRTGPGLCAGAQQLPRGASGNGEVIETVTVDKPGDPLGRHLELAPACGAVCEGTEDELKHCEPGRCEGCCGCSQECTTDPCGQNEDDAAAEEADALYPDGPAPHSLSDAVAASPLISLMQADALPPVTLSEVHAENPPRTDVAGVVSVGVVPKMISVPSPAMQTVPLTELRLQVGSKEPDPWTAPAPASNIPDGSVSMQPEPDRDQWGRYLIMGASHTRVTTFVKAASSTFALEQWAARMVIKGLVMRPDLLALAHGMDVKRDKAAMDSIAAQAKEAAGQKVAANLGTAYHAFTERLDAGLITLEDVPEQYRGRVAQYADVVRRAGLTTCTQWIERTTAVTADQVSAALPVAGTLDRIFQLPNGELVIGDLKTGADLTYGIKEIEAQLAVYAHGVNTHGLFDWNTKTWQTGVSVRTDMGLVVHLPADGEGCTLYMIDLERGWRRAQLCGQAMADQKAKAVLMPLTLPEAPAVEPRERPEVTRAVVLFQDAESRDALLDLARLAHESQAFTPEEMAKLEAVARARWEELVPF